MSKPAETGANNFLKAFMIFVLTFGGTGTLGTWLNQAVTNAVFPSEGRVFESKNGWNPSPAMFWVIEIAVVLQASIAISLMACGGTGIVMYLLTRGKR
ncbi:MAG: hypothetical protein ACRCXZ_10075 [Patescibacteria group bacterium]